VPYNRMFESFLPRVARPGIGAEVIRGLLVDTLRRIFELTPA
jgi:predicted metal-dependent phosphotriesterase family hydrolase